MEQITTESWVDIEGFNSQYQISNFGRVKSLERKETGRYSKYYKYRTIPEKILSLNIDKNTHYVSITLSLEGKRLTRFIHRLVAQAFIPNPDNKCCVNHKDGNPSNNNVTNLEWVTMKENSKHAFDKQFKRKKTSWTREEVIDLMSKSFNRGVSRQLFDQTWIETNL